MYADLRYAFRQLLKSPGYTAVSLVILALGIGINTTLFSVVDHVLLQPLIFPKADRLVSLVERSGETVHPAVNYENFVAWREAQHSFTALGAANVWSEAVRGPGDAEHLTGAQITFDYLQALGVAPLRGRLFTAEDDQPKAERTVVLSEPLWRRMFGGEDSAIGGKLSIRDQSYTIIGVLPRGVIQPVVECEFWVPVAPFVWDLVGQPNRPPGPFVVLGRLKPGVTLETARHDMTTIAQQLAATHPALKDRGIVLTSLHDSLLGSARAMLWLLLGAASGVLLIACANLASLQLARALGRQREFAIRSSLGAGRGRLIALLLAESSLLGLVGAAAGAVVAAWSIDAVRTWLPAGLPRLDSLALDRRALGFALAAGVLAVLLSSLAAVWHQLRGRPRSAASLAWAAQQRPSGHRWLFGLVTAQIAITCLLLVGTGLMVRSLYRLYHANLGFTPVRVVSFVWAPPLEDAPRAAMLERAVARLSVLPGVTQVGVISEMPLGGDYFVRPLSVEGLPPPPPNQQPQGASFSVTPGYFSAVGMPILRGRGFSDRDNTMAAPKVAVIDTRLAALHFPGQDPIGRRIKFGTSGDGRPWVEVVGLVEHVENRGLGSSTDVQAYIPYGQRGAPWRMSFVVRGSGDTAPLLSEIRQTMRTLAPDIPIYSLATMDARFDATIAPQRLTGGLLGVFASLSIILATVGLYGVLSYQVGQRTRELGIRLALGAQPKQVLTMVLRQGVAVAAVGGLIGLVAAGVSSRLLKHLLYHVAPTDLHTFGAVLTLVLATALLACWLPARRATRVNPVDALRAE
ncbi:ABC transporter permease [Opitutus terrae]|uniref:Permease n=1 Tax=Opitutus terrae (strain DSM 11246 / JCM 15787 / PB90-1) TaxID=452637 RepID=B1ZXV5_OPITP|nr:ABC transporter permease [Opitutus terrae]ACB75157.1 permease [Opitutus terrae PB90-1]